MAIIERTTVTTMIQQLQPDTALVSFKDLSTTIAKANDLLPEKLIAILQELSASYSITKTQIEIGFIDSSNLLSEFVIKSWRVMEFGMNKDEQQTLMTLGNELNIVFIDQLETFVESSRSQLVEIHSQLLLEATGERIENLLEKRNELENHFSQISTELKAKTSECKINQGTIDLLRLVALITKVHSEFNKDQALASSLEVVKKLSTNVPANSTATNMMEQINSCKNKIQSFREQLPEKKRSISRFTKKFRDMNVGDLAASARNNLNKFMERMNNPDETGSVLTSEQTQTIIDTLQQGKDVLSKVTESWQTIKDEIQTVVTKLNEQINDCKTKMGEYREQGPPLSILSWKVRSICVTHGRKILEENINRLLERSNFLSDVIESGSLIEFVKTVLNGKDSLTSYEEKQIQLEQECQQIQERYDQISKEFYAVIDEINEICQSNGTSDLESIKMVDELCRAVQNGEQSIVSAYTLMRIHLSAIDIDQDLLVDSVLDALQVLNMIDGYIDTRKINDLKQTFGLEQ